MNDLGSSSIIIQQLKRMQEQLLDLSYRSPFLNFKQRDNQSVRIIQESPADLLKQLYEENGEMELVVWSDSNPVPQSIAFETLDNLPLEDRHTDQIVQTAVIFQEKLSSTLKAINRTAEDSLLERGVNLLHLGLGVLRYRLHLPGNEEKQYDAPLLLLPVKLKQTIDSKTGQTIWLLEASGDDVTINLTLCKKMAAEFDLLLPETFEENLPLYDACLEWLRAVSKIVKAQQNFEVLTDCYLGFFNFQKYALFKDMETNLELYCNHPVTMAILDPNHHSLKQEPNIEFDVNSDPALDTVFPPEQAFHVLDADSSQLSAIYQVGQGKHLTIEGPPGTGKSQTIANLIANALGEGKKVLFVSEKQAALQVVFDRLQKLGLDLHCLELHSTKATRKSVMKELEDALNTQRKHETGQLNIMRQKLPETRHLLGHYVSKLHQPRTGLNLSLFKLVGRFNRRTKIARPLIRLSGLQAVSEVQLNQTLEKLLHFQRLTQRIGSPDSHPWRLIQRTHFTSIDRDELNGCFEDILKLAAKCLNEMHAFADHLGVKPPVCLGEVATFLEVIRTLLDSPASENSILTNEQWNHLPSNVTQLTKTVKQFSSTRQSLKVNFKESWLDEPTLVFKEWNDRLRAHEKLSILRFLSPAYHRDMKDLQGCLNTESQKLGFENLSKALAKTITYAELRDLLIEQDAEARNLFGFHWQGQDTDWQVLERFSMWITRFRQYALHEYFEAKAFEVASKGKLSASEWEPRIEALQAASQLIQEKTLALKNDLNLSSQETISSLRTPISDIAEQVTRWHQSFALLDDWTEYLEAQTDCLEQPLLKDYLTGLQTSGIDSERLVETFEALFYHQLCDSLVNEEPIFQRFSNLQHQEVRKQFQELDKNITEATRQELLSKLQQLKNEAFAKSDEKMRTYVKTQIRRVRQGDSIRTLFRKASELILYLKPCLMMSPLSAAEYIDPNKVQFDLVIFDEASQVRPAEALASIIRAKQSVVVGDSKQLPPTNFFGKQVNSKPAAVEEDEQDSIIDQEIEESILDQCYKAGFNSTMLKWHYRSKHESLIAFSNSKYYKDLYTFPSAEDELYGLKFQYVPNAVYQGEGKNTGEAKAIVEEICRHACQQPYHSLGVATFGMKQRDVIMDLLDAEKLKDPILARFLDSHPNERFFIKNLESVQGDERDVMLMSVTYGRGNDGRLKMAFGPINGDNGWRRLNVIASRARYIMKVFASFRVDELDPTRLNSVGARDFREFLFFAENKRFSFQPSVDGDCHFDSDFEESVHTALTEAGYRCVTQVGQSGYRIDIAILDNEIEGLYIAGVECDGALYHGSACARDRDRLRQAVLEGLNWNIIRIWSTAWFKNPKAEIERVIAEIEEARIKTHERRAKQIEETLAQASVELDIEEEAFGDELLLVEAPIYDKYLPQAFGQPNQIEINKTFLGLVMTILAHEAPLHIDEMTRLVVAHWGLSRISDRTRELTSRAISALEEMGEPIRYIAPFVYHLNLPVKARNRKALKPLPKFDFISDEEIEMAVQLLLSSGTILPEEQIAQKVAKILGYERTTVAIKGRILTVVQVMLSRSTLAHASYGVRLS